MLFFFKLCLSLCGHLVLLVVIVAIIAPLARIYLVERAARNADPAGDLVIALLHLFDPADLVGEQAPILVGHEPMLRLEQQMAVRRRFEQEVAHDPLGIPLEIALGARHEGAIGNEAVERVPDEGEFEKSVPFLRPKIGADLLQGQVAVLQLGQFRDRELLLNEQADLLQVLWTHMFPQRLANRMRSGFRNGNEQELVKRRDDHLPENVGERFSRKAATPSR